MWQTLQTISAFLTLILAIIGSIVALLKYLDVPINIFKKNQARKQRELTEYIQSKVKEDFEPTVKDIYKINEEQNKKMDLLIGSSKDMLRANIVRIIDKYKPYKKITERDREILDQLFQDYKNESGNGSVERAYNRTLDWEIISEDTGYLTLSDK